MSTTDKTDEEREERLSPFYAILGSLAFFVLNFVVVLFYNLLHTQFHSNFNYYRSMSREAMEAAQASLRPILVVVLAAGAFVTGLLMRRYGSPKVKAIGLGVMIGWAVASVVSLGSCTGIQPVLKFY